MLDSEEAARIQQDLPDELAEDLQISDDSFQENDFLSDEVPQPAGPVIRMNEAVACRPEPVRNPVLVLQAVVCVLLLLGILFVRSAVPEDYQRWRQWYQNELQKTVTVEVHTSTTGGTA